MKIFVLGPRMHVTTENQPIAAKSKPEFEIVNN